MFSFFKKNKNKNIETDNGLNAIYHNNGSGNLKATFYKINGLIEGVLKSYNAYNDKLRYIEKYKTVYNGDKTIYENGEIKDVLVFENGKIATKKIPT